MDKYPENPVMDNDPNSPHRGTGRTTRQLDEAKRIAASGTNVLFVCPSMIDALRILQGPSIEGLSVASPHNGSSMQNLCRGRQGIIIVDHACPDSFREIAKQANLFAGGRP